MTPQEKRLNYLESRVSQVAASLETLTRVVQEQSKALAAMRRDVADVERQLFPFLKTGADE